MTWKTIHHGIEARDFHELIKKMDTVAEKHWIIASQVFDRGWKWYAVMYEKVRVK